MYRLAAMHSVEDRLVDRQTDRQTTFSCQQPIMLCVIFLCMR